MRKGKEKEYKQKHNNKRQLPYMCSVYIEYFLCTRHCSLYWGQNKGQKTTISALMKLML